MKMFFQGWIILFKDVKKEIDNLWKKYCPKFCKCNAKKEK